MNRFCVVVVSVFLLLFGLFDPFFVFARFKQHERERPLWCGRPYFLQSLSLSAREYNHNTLQNDSKIFIVKPGLIPYTTDETNGTLIVVVDPRFGSTVTFRAFTSTFTVVDSINIPTSTHSVLSFDLSKFALGSYTNVTSTIRSNNGTLLAITSSIVARFPSKKNAIKVNVINTIALLSFPPVYIPPMEVA
jgi:hypothetical protein